MAVPFYLKNVISSVKIADGLGITASEFSQANAIYGYVALLSYFVGGYFADRFNLKKLTLLGLSGIEIVSIWYGLIPFINSGKIIQVYIIFSLWSFITCFIFWSALWKLLSEQGTPAENGKLNGIHGSLNGLIGTILIAFAYLVFWLFENIWTASLGNWAFSTLVFIFTGLIFINCLLLWKFVPDLNHNSNQTNTFDIKDLGKTLKNFKLWIVTLLIMGVYMYQSGLSVFVTFMQDALKIIPIIVVVVGILRTYFFRFLFSAPAGKLADRTQKYILFIVIGLTLASIITITAISLPGYTETSFATLSKTWKIVIQSIIIILYLMLGIICWALVTNRWATIYEINISQKEYAASVGLISFIAFSPDAWFWQIDSLLLKNYGTEAGYLSNKLANQISLAIITVIGLLAAISGFVLLLVLQKEKKVMNYSVA
ncbi:MFS transporter [Spiroplasma melliferum]|uniref:Transmembrane protein permease n=2 Tax=Spiroplasma melliferum TaxID=2134 RepID=A0AAI9X114_SPIME|nr:MFS transporter [Spiroplasma melliferum]ELL44934.1 putative permease [Spiroplasma melliferum IPMB4A]KAI92574.1 transmembrane protein permease [Spiroplasma melliferum KC3]